MAALIGLPIGFSIAQETTPVESVEVGDPVDRESNEDSQGLEPAPLGDPGLNTDYAIEGSPTRFWVDECRKDVRLQREPPLDALACEMIIAVDEGRLTPGEFSASEPEAELDAADER